MADLTPYSTAKSLFGVAPSWVTGEDQLRLQAYTVYEALYDNVPEAFKLVQRGSEQNPIYIPSAKTLIEATNRFLAKRWNFAVNPLIGSPAERQAISQMLLNIFRREQMYAKFATQKRYGLIRGDAVWQVVADDTKPQGKRVSVYEVDPAEYFPIENPDNPEQRIGAHIVSQWVNDNNETIIRRQTYRKTETGAITYELSWFEMGGWDDREGGDLKPVSAPSGQPSYTITLPPAITAIPVYHVKNNRKPNSPFGISELAGLERIIASVNQAISDEEVALAMAGLGMYATTSGPPVDDQGNEQNWQIGPGYVVEIDDNATWERVSGVGSIDPVLSHVRYLEGAMREASGVPDIAIGSVDVQTAESGIALNFKMSPLLAKNEEKESELLSVMDHLLYDLTTMWIPAYEGLTTAAQVVSIVDDPMPINRVEVVNEVVQLLGAGIISVAYAQQYLSEKLGYEFPDTMLTDLVEEQKALAEARNADPFLSRVEQELNQ